MREFEDACGRVVAVPNSPQRIVCLCPSLTETLVALGVQVVGRTRYCIHPAEALASVAVVGGTKNIDFTALAQSRPDLIIAEKEENRREDVEAMAQHWPVYVCDIQNLDQAFAAITQLGVLTGETERAGQQVAEIQAAWREVPRLDRPLRVLYLIWRKPWMAAGADTYIDTVLQRAGMVNVAASLSGRYPQIASEDLAGLRPDVCLLSSEPYPFQRKHEAELSALMPDTQMHLVDGEMFSWYGIRMRPAAAYISTLLETLSGGVPAP